MNDTLLDTLDPEDKITFLIGKAARLSVYLEHAVRLIWLGLVDDTRAMYALPRSARDVLDAVARMTQHIGLSRRELLALDATFRAVAQAHSLRNQMVHEFWSHQDDKGDWRPIPRDSNDILQGKIKPAWKQGDFEKSIEAFVVAGRRIAAVSSLIGTITQSELRKTAEGDMSDSPIRPVMLAIAEGTYSDVPTEFIEYLDENFAHGL